MINNKIFRSNNVFMKFMVSYITLVFIFIIIGIFAYSLIINTVKSFAISEGLNELERARNNFEMRLTEMDDIAYQMSTNEDLLKLSVAQRPFSPSDYFAMINIIKEIPTYYVSNKLIDEVNVFFVQSGLTFSSNYFYDLPPDINANSLKLDGMDFTQFANYLNENRFNKALKIIKIAAYNMDNRDTLCYIQPIPTAIPTQAKAFIMFEIENKVLLENFHILDIKNHGMFYVENSTKEVVAAINYDPVYDREDMELATKYKGYRETHMNGKKAVELKIKSQNTGLTYTAVISNSLFMDKAKSVRDLFIYTAIIMIGLGMVISLIFSYKNSVPVKKIMRAISNLKDEGRGIAAQNEYEYIENALSTLAWNNGYLQEEITKQLPLLKESFWERLLRGEYINESEIRSELSLINLEFGPGKLVVAVFRINGFNDELNDEILTEITQIRIVARTVIQKRLPPNCYTHNTDIDKIAVIFSSDSECDMELSCRVEELSNKIIESLKLEYGIIAACGIGRLYSDITGTVYSFREASKVFDYKLFKENKKVMWYRDIPKEDSSIYYPIEVESKLMGLARGGDIKEITSLLGIVFDKNMNKKSLTSTDLTQLLYELRGTLLKILDNMKNNEVIDIGSIYKQLRHLNHQMNNMEDLQLIILDTYKDICSVVIANKRNRSSSLNNKILAYIQDNFTNGGLCLTSLSEEFDLTENYISQFFKEHNEDTFSSYLEKLRLGKAIELFGRKDLLVNDIALMVGYVNINSYHKAFKRVYGMAPGEFRKKAAKTGSIPE